MPYYLMCDALVCNSTQQVIYEERLAMHVLIEMFINHQTMNTALSFDAVRLMAVNSERCSGSASVAEHWHRQRRLQCLCLYSESATE